MIRLLWSDFARMCEAIQNRNLVTEKESILKSSKLTDEAREILSLNLESNFIKDKNFYYSDLLSYEKLDETPSLAWSPSCGLICDEWMNILFRYAQERRRKLLSG